MLCDAFFPDSCTFSTAFVSEFSCSFSNFAISHLHHCCNLLTFYIGFDFSYEYSYLNVSFRVQLHLVWLVISSNYFGLQVVQAFLLILKSFLPRAVCIVPVAYIALHVDLTANVLPCAQKLKKLLGQKRLKSTHTTFLAVREQVVMHCNELSHPCSST